MPSKVSRMISDQVRHSVQVDFENLTVAVLDAVLVVVLAAISVLNLLTVGEGVESNRFKELFRQMSVHGRRECADFAVGPGREFSCPDSQIRAGKIGFRACRTNCYCTAWHDPLHDLRFPVHPWFHPQSVEHPVLLLLNGSFPTYYECGGENPRARPVDNCYEKYCERAEPPCAVLVEFC